MSSRALGTLLLCCLAVVFRFAFVLFTCFPLPFPYHRFHFTWVLQKGNGFRRAKRGNTSSKPSIHCPLSGPCLRPRPRFGDIKPGGGRAKPVDRGQPRFD